MNEWMDECYKILNKIKWLSASSLTDDLQKSTELQIIIHSLVLCTMTLLLHFSLRLQFMSIVLRRDYEMALFKYDKIACIYTVMYINYEMQVCCTIYIYSGSTTCEL